MQMYNVRAVPVAPLNNKGPESLDDQVRILTALPDLSVCTRADWTKVFILLRNFPDRSV